MWPFNNTDDDNDPNPWDCDHESTESEVQDEYSVYQGPFYDTDGECLYVLLAHKEETECLDCGKDFWEYQHWNLSEMKRVSFDQDAIEDVDPEEVL